MPALFSFVISFLYCGVLWMLHHMAMHFIRHMQMGLVWLNLLFLMAVSTMPFSCGLLAHYLRNRAAQEIYFANMFLAAALLTAQWLMARRKNLLNEDDPYRTRLMGQRIMVFPVAVLAGAVGAYFNPLAGSYALAGTLLLFRLVQRKWFQAQTEKVKP